MASKCTITFENNPFGVYYAGQIVSGTAELITTRPKTVRSIYISVSGFAEVRWTENITKQNAEGKSEKATETYSSSEMYYSSENFVYGQSGGPQLELPAGKYVFPFQATIPPNAPTSFNGQYGQIQHEVALVIDRVMRYNNTFKQGYTVLSPYDLNLNPENAKPLQKTEEKTFCWSFCCGTKGPMIMKVDVPFSAYAPGQKIRFHVILDNQSDVHCYDVKVRLMKHVTYTSRSPTPKSKITEIKVADNHCGEVVKLNKAEFNEFLQIPSTSPSSLASCSIIKISYTLRFIAKVSRIHGDLVIDFPFTIGTVPLYASTSDYHNTVGPITAQPGKGPAYKPLAPPMFEEDVRSEQFEQNTFKPRYPVFLSDANVNNTIGGGSAPASPPQSNSLYPTTPSAAKHPQPPIALPTAISPVSPKPTPVPQPAPISVPKPIAATAPMPVQPNAPPSSSFSNKPVSKPSAPSDPLEVLGFSIPPDYEPTPGAPKADKSGGGIGWK